MLSFIKKLIPEKIFEFFQPAYHFALAFLGALIYGFPSKKLYVIGVTGTKGKTTTCNLIHRILNSNGHKTGLTTTVNFKIGEREWPNDKKQTMLGRFALQKLLKLMVKENCKYAVVETSSEGILQHRHRFIDYSAAVFLNISPEHLERHGSFENYRAEKIKLFEKVAKKENGVGVFNLDDKNVDYFLKPEIGQKFGFFKKIAEFSGYPGKTGNNLELENFELNPSSSEFLANGVKYKTNLIGEFNIYNAAAAICVALSLGVPEMEIQKSLADFKPVRGRMEVVDSKKGFIIVIDYAHEPKSLEEVYKAVSDSKLKSKNSKLICLLGAAGGGRDKWKRPEMGRVAAAYCDEIILTNEDPYDEQPEKIIEDIFYGCLQIKNQKSEIRKITDRKEAIKKAISLAKKGDVVVLSGKGGEISMCVENNKKIPWDEKKTVVDLLKD